MCKRQVNLERILKHSGHLVNANHLPYLTKSQLDSCAYAGEILRIYNKCLGGVQETFPANLRRWDIVADGIAIELDEEQHFNRYRNWTLQSTVYNELRNFPLAEYRRYCEEHESECLQKARSGGWWSNPKCKSQFGEASPPGVLDDKGAPRWKQRAFYDFLRDLTPLVIKDVPFARVSVWDRVDVNGKKELVGRILDRCDTRANKPIFELVQKRV